MEIPVCRLPRVAPSLNPDFKMDPYLEIPTDLSSRPTWLTRPIWLIASLTTVGLVLRLLFLGRQSLWVDEAYSCARAAYTWPNLVRMVASHGANMWLYYAVLHLWTGLAGTSEFELRLPSALFATATIPLIYRLGTDLYDRRVGLIGAFLLAINTTSVRYGQEARSYALLVMLVTLSSLFYLRSLRRPSLANCASYALSGALSVYAHLFGVLLLPAQWLSLFLLRPGRKATWRLTASALLFGALALPAFARAREHSIQIIGIPTMRLSSVVKLGEFLAGESLVVKGAGATLGLFYLAGVAACVATAVRQKSRRPAIEFLMLLVIVPVTMTIAVSLLKPLFVDRYLLICQPFFVLLVAIGISETLPRPALIATLAIMLALGLHQDYSYYRYFEKTDWRGGVHYIAANARPSDALIIYPQSYRPLVDYYLRQPADAEESPAIIFPSRASLEDYIRSETTPDQIYQLLENAPAIRQQRVWVVLPAELARDMEATMLLLTLRPSYRIVSTPAFGGVRVLLLEKRSTSPSHLRWHFLKRWERGVWK